MEMQEENKEVETKEVAEAKTSNESKETKEVNAKSEHRENRRRSRDNRKSEEDKEFIEKLVTLNRTAKVVKGGRRFSFSALTVVGDKKGRVGYGFGKANDVTEAIKKSIEKAKRNLIVVPVKNGTIPHEMLGNYKSSSVLLKPACPGTGIIAGGAVRAIMDAAGATDIISKSLGSSTSVNVVRATFDAISHLLDGKQVASGRGKTLDELWG